MTQANYAICTRPFRGAKACGDIGIVTENSDTLQLTLIDVLGHGEETRPTADLMKRCLENQVFGDPIEALQYLHDVIRRSRGARGAVAGVCIVVSGGRHATYAALGNIGARQFGSGNFHSTPILGILGEKMRTPRVEVCDLAHGDVFVLYTDGIRSTFGHRHHPWLLCEEVGTVAKRIVREFGRQEDDTSCIVYRCPE